MLNLQITAIAAEIANAVLRLTSQRHRLFPGLALLQSAGWANCHALAATLAAAFTKRQAKISAHHRWETTAVQPQSAHAGHFLTGTHTVTTQNALAHITHNKTVAVILGGYINLTIIFLRLYLIFLRIMQQTALKNIAAATFQTAAGLIHRLHLVIPLGNFHKIAIAIFRVQIAD